MDENKNAVATSDSLNSFLDWLLDELLKGGLLMNCPNCDADMEYDDESGTWECPDCGYVDDCH